MKIVNDTLVADNLEEAVQIIKDLGLEPYYKKGYGIAMGMLHAEILDNEHDYPVIWDCDCENGAFKVYDDICIAGDKYFLSFIGNNRFMLDDCTVVHNSTGAAYIFAKLKMAGIDSEYVSEYAKDHVWQGDQFVLQHCQLYVTGKQCLKVARLLGKVDVIVTDSPIAIGAMYTDEKPYQDVCLYEAKKYKNTFNIFVDRRKDYNPNGRNQTEEEARNIDQRILDFLNDNGIEYTRVDGNIAGYDQVVENIAKILRNK